MSQESSVSAPTGHLGKPEACHRFFLNPYPDARFSTCPDCLGPTGRRKLHPVIHVGPAQVLVLDKTCRTR